jgi:hypothetical protein
LARRRFLLGYPPRKDKDTSIGDAVNWEWIFECSIKSGRSVIIVSRDEDYGPRADDTSYLNEWLRQEFSERVKNNSQISLTDSLASALKELKIPVTKAETDAEAKIIKSAEQETPIRSQSPVAGHWEGFDMFLNPPSETLFEFLRRVTEESSKDAKTSR